MIQHTSVTAFRTRDKNDQAGSSDGTINLIIFLLCPLLIPSYSTAGMALGILEFLELKRSSAVIARANIKAPREAHTLMMPMLMRVCDDNSRGEGTQQHCDAQ